MRFLYRVSIKFFLIKVTVTASVTELAEMMKIKFFCPLPLLSSFYSVFIDSLTRKHSVRNSSVRKRSSSRLLFLFICLAVYISVFHLRLRAYFSPSILSTSLFWQKLRRSPKETQVMPGLCKRHSSETRICSDVFKLFDWQTIVNVSRSSWISLINACISLNDIVMKKLFHQLWSNPTRAVVN